MTSKNLIHRYNNAENFKKFFLKILLIIYFVIHDFSKNKLQIKAASLSFVSILAVIPAFTLILGISQFFGANKFIEKMLFKSFQSQKQVFNYIVDLSEQLLINAKHGLIAIVSVVLIIWTVLRVIIWLKKILDIIWTDSRKLTIFDRIKRYFLFFIVPFFLLIVSAIVGIAIKIIINRFLNEGTLLYEYFSPFLLFLIKILPFLVVCFALMLIYKVAPYSKVKIRYALISGFLIGLAYQIVQYFYVHFQLGVSNYNAVYGVFAIIPLFLIWTQLNWTLVLFGAQLTFTLQNFKMRIA